MNKLTHPPSPVAARKRRASKPSTPTYHHGDLRNALIVEGRRLLEELGAHELSLRHVARSVGVSIAAPSHHFDGKEGLLAAIAADGFRELAAARREIATTTDDPLIKVYRMLDSYVRFAQREKGLFNLMVGPRILAKNAHQELSVASSESFDLFAAAVCDYARSKSWSEDDLNLVVHAAWSVEHGLATLVLASRVPRADRPIDVQQMIHFSISLLLSGVTAGPAHLARIARLTARPRAMQSP
jgi:AcrR family transcriptional regulator